jgi:hypothetical protein
VARKPKPSEEIAQFNPNLIWHLPGRGCLATDPAVGAFDFSEYFLEQDEAVQARMLTVRLEAESAAHKAVSEGFAKMATAMKRG